MRVLILGAGGMIGKKLTARIVAGEPVAGRGVDELVLQDLFPLVAPAGAPVLTSDLSAPGAAEAAIAARPDVIFHLAAVLSGEAESDFEKGQRVNIDGTRGLFEAIRRAGEDYCPKVIFSSTIAVFGKPFPASINDDFLLAPLTSYGAEKAVCELLLADYSRRGFLDGVGVRLPTICVRPGLPNKAASGFYSNIIREPLNGEEAVLPVPESMRHWFASPRSAVRFLLRASELTESELGDRRNLTLPGLSCTVGEQIAALERIAGARVTARIRRDPDPAILAIVAGWPERFETKRADALGFQAEASFEEIIRIHIEDELGGKFVA